MEKQQGRLLDGFAEEFHSLPAESFIEFFNLPSIVVEIPDADVRPSPYDTDEKETVDPSAESSAPDRQGTPFLWFLKKGARNAFGARITVGRSTNNDIVIGHTTVSKVHAFFEKRGPSWTVGEMSSRNGTFLGGKRLYENHPAILTPMDVVRFGSVRSTFLTPMGLYNYANLHHRIRKLKS